MQKQLAFAAEPDAPPTNPRELAIWEYVRFTEHVNDRDYYKQVRDPMYCSTCHHWDEGDLFNVGGPDDEEDYDENIIVFCPQCGDHVKPDFLDPDGELWREYQDDLKAAHT